MCLILHWQRFIDNWPGFPDQRCLKWVPGNALRCKSGQHDWVPIGVHKYGAGTYTQNVSRLGAGSLTDATFYSMSTINPTILLSIVSWEKCWMTLDPRAKLYCWNNWQSDYLQQTSTVNISSSDCLTRWTEPILNLNFKAQLTKMMWNAQTGDRKFMLQIYESWK